MWVWKWSCSGGSQTLLGPCRVYGCWAGTSTLLTVPTMLPFPLWQPQTAFYPLLQHSSCDLPAQHVDFLCSARLEGLPGVFHDLLGFEGYLVLHAGVPTPGMEGHCPPEGAEGTLSGLLPLRCSAQRMKWPGFQGRGFEHLSQASSTAGTLTSRRVEENLFRGCGSSKCPLCM